MVESAAAAPGNSATSSPAPGDGGAIDPGVTASEVAPGGTSAGGAVAGERAIGPLTPEQLAAAATLVAPCTAAGTLSAAFDLLAELSASEEGTVHGLTVDGQLLGLSATRRTGMTFELALLVVAPAARRQGHGKELLIDALVRAGRRPTVTEVAEADLSFYQATRFKPVSRRKQPDGSFRFRLGWHPPGQRTPVPGA